ncbi:MAG: CehA/McbA family metallohydrolase [Chloroflexi bacterium]|nr:CehA/McbA family metallohydrolase [Chloroflexota bacterium]
MNDYAPIDISALCNAGIEVLGDGEAPKVGRQTMRGLPFQIGADGASPGDKIFLAVEGSSSPISIPIGGAVRNVVFAHRLLESDVRDGGQLGRHVADYIFHLSDGQELSVPVREKFEIHVLSTDFFNVGQPYRAVSDRDGYVISRHAGPWDEAGRRQTEAMQGNAESYYLWAWRNPEPDITVESVEIVPRGPRFFIAAVTLGHVDEYPFVTQGRREARITLFDGRETKENSGLEVEVDRGIATYVFPLPEASVEEFQADVLKGFGEPLNTKSSPAYVEIAATPSATVTVKQDGNVLGEVKWSEVEEKGAAATQNMRIELLDRGRNWVKVTVLDDDTGRPVPCRVHFRSPEGIPYQPHGHHNQVNSNQGTWHIDVGGDVRLGQITYAYIDGNCQGWLPRGDVIVDVARGYEYEPLRTRVNIQPGQQELTLRLKRWTNMNAQRWFSGDSHVHFLSTQGSHFESQGEDLNVVNLLQSQWGSLFTNTEEFTGRPSVSRDGSNIVFTSQENRQHVLGHMILWGLKEPVMPWCSDGVSEGELGGIMETTMSHWADRAHAQGGRVVIPHFPSPNGEPATLIATGRVDAVEMIRHQRFNHIEYYRYLNCGYRLPLVGGTDKMSNEVPVGMYRTYAYVPGDEEFNYENWCRAVSAGRTFLSGGPMIHLSVEGQRIGDTVQMSGPGTVEVEALAESVIPINTLEIILNGRVIASAESSGGARRLELKESIQVDEHSWIAARCGGSGYFDGLSHHDVWTRGIFSHTSPIYLACGGDWAMFDPQAATYMLTLIEGGMTYIRENAARYAPGSVTHHHGEDDHMAFLLRPFEEAREAVRRRISSGS